MIEKELRVGLKSGMEARTVAIFVQLASKFSSQIHITYNGRGNVNAKSIMGMMSLGIAEGETLTIQAEGADEQEAVDAIAAYLTDGE